MRFIVFGLGTLVLAGVLWWLWPEPTITNYPSSGTDIIAFGDSLVAGVGSRGGGFVAELEETIGQPVINLGVAGDTTQDGLARIDEIKEYNPKVVILLLGGNDAIKKIPLETTHDNLAGIITEIHSTGAVVVLLGVRSGILADSYQEMYEGLAKQYGTAYVSDLLSGVFGRPNLMSDPIHPNDAGYKKISERVAPVVVSVL